MIFVLFLLGPVLALLIGYLIMGSPAKSLLATLYSKLGDVYTFST
jgi:hypothetical protein